MTTHPICDDPGATDDRGSRKGHMRSHGPSGSICIIFRSSLTSQVVWHHLRVSIAIMSRVIGGKWLFANYSTITRDMMEIETRKRCQTTWLVKPLRKIMHIDPFVPWLDLDLMWPEVRFWSWPFKVKKCSEPARQGKHDEVTLFSYLSYQKSY